MKIKMVNIFKLISLFSLKKRGLNNEKKTKRKNKTFTSFIGKSRGITKRSEIPHERKTIIMKQCIKLMLATKPKHLRGHTFGESVQKINSRKMYVMQKTTNALVCLTNIRAAGSESLSRYQRLKK